MNLSIDIGNTNITLGLFQGSQLLKRSAWETRKGTYYFLLKRYLKRRKVKKVIVSSVVPQATGEIERALKKLKVENIFILGKNLAVPVKNQYKIPRQVGQDRLVNAFAAINFYGSPAIVVDFGTAVTFDAISSKNEYCGGLIIPGLETSLSALAEKTALLPKIKLSQPSKQIIGKTTRNSMLNGLIYGFASLADGLIRKLKQELGKKTIVIGTGGNIELISSHCREFKAIDIDLTLKGLNLLLSYQ
jgi:type III pantothenate kinase